jgi:flavin reductase (DIM6/NTAB) family NADH-FMN oxidoreductase RutF
MITLDPVHGADGMPDAAMLRRAYGCFPSGVTSVCALRDGVPVGIAASSFTSVSMSPPLVSLCVQLSSSTWPLLADRPRLGLSVLGSTHDHACRQIASKTGDRFAGVDWTASEEGAVFLRGATAWLDCTVHETVRAGDHDLVLLRVESLKIHDGVAPLVFHDSAFHRLARAA